MTRAEKEKEVAWLKEQFQTVRALVLTDYRGLSVSQMNELRSNLRNEGAKLKVIKNTLLRLGYEGTQVSLLEDDAVGPRAAAWTDHEDKAPAMAKVLTDFAKANPNLELISGVLQGTKMAASDIESLSKLPPREQLLGRLLGTMVAPIGGFVNTLAAVPRSFLYVLRAIEEQKGASSESAAG